MNREVKETLLAHLNVDVSPDWEKITEKKLLELLFIEMDVCLHRIKSH